MGHTEALAVIYVEACVAFRRAKRDSDFEGIVKFHDLCQALEKAYPNQIAAFREFNAVDA